MLQFRILRIKQRRHQRARQFSILHLVKGSQGRAANMRVGVVQSRQRCLAVVDADERVDKRMLQKAVACPAQPVDKSRHRLGPADPPERLRRLAAEGRLSRPDQRRQEAGR